MNFADTKFFRYIACPLLFIATLAWWVVHPRFFTLIPLLVSLIALVALLFRKRPLKIFSGCLLFVLLTTWVPVDVSLLNVHGPPRFIPVVYGLPTEKGLEEAKQGKYYLGGCILGDLKWMFVW